MHAAPATLSLCRSVAPSPGKGSGSALRRLSLLAAGLLTTAGGNASAATITLSIQPIAGGVRLTAPADVATYYILRDSASLQSFAAVGMSMADTGVVWDIATAGFSRRFWTVRQVSVWSPEDADADGIDDIYEIRHPALNPLNPADALLTVPGQAITYLAEYRALYGLGTARPEVYSREVSFFNGEGGPAQGGIPEVYSREVSFFNGEGGPAQGGIPEVYSREVSFLNNIP